MEDKNIARYKACFVACGFTQLYWVDYEEISVPSICYDTLCIFLAIAAKNN